MTHKIIMISLAFLLLLLALSSLISMYQNWKNNSQLKTVDRLLTTVQAGAPRLS